MERWCKPCDMAIPHDVVAVETRRGGKWKPALNPGLDVLWSVFDPVHAVETLVEERRARVKCQRCGNETVLTLI